MNASLSARPGSGSREPVVLHVLEALETGCARHVLDIVRAVDGVRHEIVVPRERVGGVTDHRAVGSMREAGAGIHLVEMRRLPVRPENVAAVLKVRSLVRRLAPDVVHCHSSIAGAVGRLAALGTGSFTLYTPNGLARGRAALLAERLLGHITDRFIAVSETEAAYVSGLRLVSTDRLVMIPNGVDLEPVAPRPLRSLLGVDAGTPLVGTMGRLSPQKAPEVFIAACAKVSRSRPGCHFVLIGDGPLRKVVKQRVEAYHLGPVFHWLPELPDAAAYLHDLTAFALPSRFEGGPYSPLEAIRAGVPVVLSDVVGNRDVIEHGRSGLLVPPDNPVTLAKAILDVVSNPAAAEAYVAGARIRLHTHFDLRVSARELGNLYRASLLADRDRTRQPAGGEGA